MAEEIDGAKREGAEMGKGVFGGEGGGGSEASHVVLFAADR